MKKITSPDNPTFRQLRTLAGSSRERRRLNRTVLDGLHLLQAYVARVGPPELVALSDSAANSGEIAGFLAGQPGMRLVVLSDALFGKVGLVSTPTGVLSLIGIPAARPVRRPEGSCVLLDAVQDAGNLGSILRTAAAAGVADAYLGRGCAQAWSPKVLRAAMGAHFDLAIQEHADLRTVLREFVGVSISASLRGSKDLYELDLAGPVAWLFGNEGTGLSPELEGMANQAVRIPMPGGSESLNVAAAAAVCLFEEVRQKSRLKTRAGRAAPPA